MDFEYLKKAVKDAVVDAIAVSLDAQLKAVKKLKELPAEKIVPNKEGKSQVDLVEDILKKATSALHINEIIDQVEKVHHVQLDRESIVSALTKKVTKQERFIRVAKNTFALKGGKE